MNLKFYVLAISLFIVFEDTLIGQSINRGPYMQKGTSTSMVIKWRTDTATDSKVWYGNSPTNLNFTSSSGSNTINHEIELTGLASNTTYYYAVGNSAGQMTVPDFEHYFLTSPLNNTTQTLRTWVIGDPGTQDDNQRNVRDAYYDFIGNEHTDVMLFLGDNAYDDGTQEEYQFSLFENMYEEKLLQSPSYSCYGNHEAHSSDTETQTGPYYDIFTFPANAEAGGSPSGTEAYYSFNYGNIHFISLNSEDSDREPGGPMLSWLQNDLDATNQDWIVVIFHHPAYTGNNGNVSDLPSKGADMRENALPILEAAGVDLVMFGHSHNYQRSFLIKDHYDVSSTFDPATMGVNMGDGKVNGDSPYYKAIGGPQDGDGTVYMVTGSAGQAGSGDLNHPIMFHSDNKLGSVALEVNDLQMDVNFIDDNGNIEDYFTIVKQNEPPIVDITNPTDETYYETLQTITINADASDSNGSVTEVEFFINNVSIGVDYTAPYAINWTIPVAGSYRIKAIAKDNDDNVNASSIGILAGQVTICSTISGGNNDAEERGDGSVSTGSSDLEFVFDGSNQEVGIRFTNLNIPQGATIISAKVQFTVDETANSNPCNLNIYGEASPDPIIFSTNQFDISSRNKTNTSVSWSPPNWLSVGDSGPAQLTEDISAVIQEIVDQTQYTSSSSIVLIINGTGERVAESFNGSAQNAAEICIEYLPYCTDDDNDGTCNANDQCPGGPEPGTVCNDGNPGTYNDVITLNCNCAGTPYDCPVAMANIGDVCTDNDPGTYDDMIDANCNCTGIPYDCPFLMANIGDECDDGDPNTYFDMIDENCTCSGSPLGNGTTVSSKVNSSSDDAEERSGGSVSTSSSDLELVFDNSNQKVGMRFNDLEIPQGAIILDAYIQFTVDETNNGNPSFLTIRGENSDNALTFNTSGYNISQRPLTNASASWTPADWVISGNAGPEQQTVDIASVIQEITDRPGYSAESSIVIIIQGTGERVAESYDGESEKAPVLFVTYEFDCQDSDGDGTCDQNDLCPGGPEPGTVCDDGNPDTFNDMIDNNCNCTGIPAGTSITVCGRIATGDDDAEERPTGAVKTTSSDLELITDGNNDQTVGMRFTGLEIPQGAIINSASIQFTADESNNTNPCLLNIFGQASDDAQSFSSSDFDLTSRPQTNSQISWSPSDWIGVGDAGPAQKTNDISPIIQEIVGRPGYTANSSIVVMIDGVGKRVAEAYNGVASKAPELCVEYTLPAAVSEGEVPETAEATKLEEPWNSKKQQAALQFEVPVKVFPNPAKDNITIAFINDSEEVIDILIKDLNGRIIYKTEGEVYPGQNNILLQDLQLIDGIYFINLNFQDFIKIAKFVIFK